MYHKKKKATAHASSARALAPNEVGFFAQITAWTPHAKYCYSYLILRSGAEKTHTRNHWVSTTLLEAGPVGHRGHRLSFSTIRETLLNSHLARGKGSESCEPTQSPFFNNLGYLGSLQLRWKRGTWSAHASVYTHTHTLFSLFPTDLELPPPSPSQALDTFALRIFASVVKLFDFQHHQLITLLSDNLFSLETWKYYQISYRFCLFLSLQTSPPL